MNSQFDAFVAASTTYLAAFGINFFAALVTLAAGFALSGWVSRIVDRAVRKADKVDPVFYPLPGKIVRVAIIVFTLLAVLNRFGVETASLIALLGAAGLAIGLALQGTLSNVAAGVMLLIFRPFKIGDAINLDGQVFIIDCIDFFVCEAHLPDGPSVVLPNSKIWGQTIINYSVTDQDRRRIDESYGISYGDDIDAAIAILRRVADEEPRVLQDPEPLIKVEKLGDSSVNILFRVWTARSDWLATKLDLLQRCKEALEAGGCSIPFPQRDVHLFQQQVGAKTAD